MAGTQEAIEGMQETLRHLENRIQLLEIIAKKTISETQPQAERETTKVIQINAKGKKYFCRTPEEQRVFSQNNPGVQTETFNIELSPSTAESRLNDPENKKAFTARSNT